MLYESICSENIRLEQEIKSIESTLKSLPEGKLVCTQSGKYTKWYQSDGHQLTYIPKRNKALAEQLAVKNYLSLTLEELLQEKRALNFYLRHHNTAESRANQLLSNDSGYSQLLSPYFKPQSQGLHQWMHQPYEKNPLYPEQCIHKTSNGEHVRSKSESIIAMLLHTHKIPFRYENALVLGETTLYPDFTIRHPINGSFYYWEHFGMLDNPSYSQNCFTKLQLYTMHGLFPSIHLITTYETKEHPLNYDMVENLIRFYFL